MDRIRFPGKDRATTPVPMRASLSRNGGPGGRSPSRTPYVHPELPAGRISRCIGLSAPPTWTHGPCRHTSTAPPFVEWAGKGEGGNRPTPRGCFLVAKTFFLHTIVRLNEALVKLLISSSLQKGGWSKAQGPLTGTRIWKPNIHGRPLISRTLRPFSLFRTKP